VSLGLLALTLLLQLRVFGFPERRKVVRDAVDWVSGLGLPVGGERRLDIGVAKQSIYPARLSVNLISCLYSMKLETNRSPTADDADCPLCP
jgi:hypothetical protein